MATAQTTETKPKTRKRSTTGPARKAPAKAPVKKSARKSAPNAKELAAKKKELAAEEKALAEQKVKDAASKKLDGMAKTIETHLSKMQVAEGRYDQHRISAGIHIANAQAEAKIAGITFTDWWKTHISAEFSYSKANKLLKIGRVANKDGTDAALALLEDQRSKQRQADAKQREKKADEKKAAEAKPAKSGVETARDVLNGLDDDSAIAVVKETAQELGATIITSGKASMDDAKEVFDNLSAADQAGFIEWAAAELGGTFSLDAE